MIITYPLFVELERKRTKPKRIYASMNVYRNLHHHVASSVKHAYKDIAWAQLAGFKELITPCRVEVTLYAPDKRDRDLSNFCSVIQKYSDDAVVEYGLLPDDSVKFIKEVIYRWGGVDTTNPRIEVNYVSV